MLPSGQNLGGEHGSGAETTCSQGVWPACTDTIYIAQASANIINYYALGDPNALAAGAQAQFDGLDHKPPFNSLGGYSFYENSTEVGDCGTALKGLVDETACIQRRCSDGFDNDGNGLVDDKDPVCLFQLCNNGFLDPGEDCIDVGGVCVFRQKQTVETGTDCSDGYDNDCNTKADQFDPTCIDYFCGNGIKDPVSPNQFVKSTYSPQNYLLGASAGDYDINEGEKCIDII